MHLQFWYDCTLQIEMQLKALLPVECTHIDKCINRVKLNEKKR